VALCAAADHKGVGVSCEMLTCGLTCCLYTIDVNCAVGHHWPPLDVLLFVAAV
jgi:hypothetical protein